MFVKTIKHLDKIIYFSIGNWRIHIDRTLKVWEELNSSDKEIFFFDIRQIEWAGFAPTFWRGLKTYILKESINDSKAREKYRKLWYMHYGLTSVLVLIMGYYVLKLFFI